MKNEVNYIQGIKIFFIHDETNETKKVKQNLEKLRCDSFG